MVLTKISNPVIPDKACLRKQKRIRVAVPNVMHYDPAPAKPTYHAFWDESKGYAKPNDGRPVYEGLRPEFVWPQGA